MFNLPESKKTKRIALALGVGLSIGAQESFAQDFQIAKDKEVVPEVYLEIETDKQLQFFSFLYHRGLVKKVANGYYDIDEEALEDLLRDDFNPIKEKAQIEAVNSALKKAFGDDVSIENIPPFKVAIGTQDWEPPMATDKAELNGTIMVDPKLQLNPKNKLDLEALTKDREIEYRSDKLR